MATAAEAAQVQLGGSQAVAGHSGPDYAMEGFEPDTPTALSVLAASFPASSSRKRRRGAAAAAVSTGEAYPACRLWEHWGPTQHWT
jgi:hypothetical protein